MILLFLADSWTRGTTLLCYVSIQTIFVHLQTKKTHRSLTLLLVPAFSKHTGGGKMYRTAAKRLLGGARYYYSTNFGLRCQPPQKLVLSSRFFTSEPQPFPDPHSINRGIPVVTTTEAPISSDSASSSSSTEDGAANPKTNYEDQQARVLQASLPYVVRLFILFLFFSIPSSFYYILIIQFSETTIYVFVSCCVYKFYGFFWL